MRLANKHKTRILVVAPHSHGLYQLLDRITESHPDEKLRSSHSKYLITVESRLTCYHCMTVLNLTMQEARARLSFDKYGDIMWHEDCEQMLTAETKAVLRSRLMQIPEEK